MWRCGLKKLSLTEILSGFPWGAGVKSRESFLYPCVYDAQIGSSRRPVLMSRSRFVVGAKTLQRVSSLIVPEEVFGVRTRPVDRKAYGKRRGRNGGAEDDFQQWQRIACYDESVAIRLVPAENDIDDDAE